MTKPQNFKISDHDRSCGKLIIDFANAKSTDEAGISFIENCFKIFNLDSHSLEKAKSIFPSIEQWKHMVNQYGNDLSTLIIQRYYQLPKSIENILSLSKWHLRECKNDHLIIFKHENINTLSEIEKHIYRDNIILSSWYKPKLDKKDYSNQLRNLIQNIFTVNDKLNNYLKRKATHKNELQALISYFQIIIDEHATIKRYIENTGILLNEIMTKKKEEGSFGLSTAIYFYNLIVNKGNVRLSGDYNLIEEPTFAEIFFMRRHQYKRYTDQEIYFFHNDDDTQPESIEEYYLLPLAYAAVNFLKNAGNKNYLHQCINEKCNSFYLTKTNTISSYCNDHCRLTCHYKRRIQSGEHRKYMKKSRKEGKYQY